MTDQAAYTVRLEDALGALYAAARALPLSPPPSGPLAELAANLDAALDQARDVLPSVDGEAVSIFERLRRGETVG